MRKRENLRYKCIYSSSCERLSKANNLHLVHDCKTKISWSLFEYFWLPFQADVVDGCGLFIDRRAVYIGHIFPHKSISGI